MKKNATKQDFYDLLKPNGDCLEWTKGKSSNGYGMTWSNVTQNNVGTHRLALEFEGIDCTDKVIMHSCDNPICCNPAHLSVGTHAENSNDKVSKNRQARGETNGTSTLTEQDVLEIRRLYALGQKQIDLALDFNTDQTNISLIVLRKSWKHI